MDEEGNESSQELHFFYDSQSKPAFVEFEGERYRYVHSLQGDIIAIVDIAGNTVVEYKYNAWGEISKHAVSGFETLGYVNPFCYRGHIFDDETRMYWLKSRYYYPRVHRFINSDTLLGQIGEIGSQNSFAYCGNNPVNYTDPDGKFAISTSLLAMAGAFLLTCLAGAAGYSLLRKRRRKITLPKVSITSSATLSKGTSAKLDAHSASDIYSAISGTAEVRADQLENQFEYDYYIAFCKKPTRNTYLFVIPVALNMEQAATMLEAEELMNNLINAYGSTGACGVYTPTQSGALALESAVGGFQQGQKPNHGNNPNAKPGQYFNHYHDMMHKYHIWYGVPLNVGIG